MKTSDDNYEDLRRLWGADLTEQCTGTDYTILADLGRAYAAKSRTGAAALLIELFDVPALAVGRRTSGCDLVPHGSMRFAHGSRQWTAPAAALLCTDNSLLEAFAVLAADVHDRLTEPLPTWPLLVGIVEEWQALLAPSERPSGTTELGLWGELWLLATSVTPDDLVAAWRGPDGEASDFFVDGKAAEVKTSRQRRRHHVSLGQVMAPVGDHAAWMLSLWVGIDPIRGHTVPMLVDQILERVANPAATLRQMLKGGYLPAARAAYDRRFVLLDEPEWYAVTDVPQVRAVDPGVSRLRYVVQLDESCRAPMPAVAALWRHFLGRDYRSLP
jgi:hypothetical protein